MHRQPRHEPWISSDHLTMGEARQCWAPRSESRFMGRPIQERRGRLDHVSFHFLCKQEQRFWHSSAKSQQGGPQKTWSFIMLPLTTAQEPGDSAPPSCSSCRAQQWLNRSFCQGSYRAAGNEMYLPSFSWKKAEHHWLWCPTEAHCQEGFSQEHSPNTQSLQPNKAGYRPPGLFYSRKGTSLTPEKLLELLGNKTGKRPKDNWHVTLHVWLGALSTA